MKLDRGDDVGDITPHHRSTNLDFCTSWGYKGVTYDALTLCYKLISFYIDLCITIRRLRLYNSNNNSDLCDLQ